MFNRTTSAKPRILSTWKKGLVDNMVRQQELKANEFIKDKAARKIAAESEFEKMVEDQTMSDFRRQDRVNKFLEGRTEEEVAEFNKTVTKYRDMVKESKDKYLATFN